MLDGTYIRSIRFNNMSLQPNVDTPQEFDLLRNSFSTGYGQGEAVVSVATKSGSNALHGTAYDFARNSVFDARNFAPPATNPVKPACCILLGFSATARSRIAAQLNRFGLGGILVSNIRLNWSYIEVAR